MDYVPNESEERDQQHGFPDDIFRASGKPEDSSIHGSSTANEIHSTVSSTYPSVNDDQPLRVNDSVSSASSTDLFRIDQTEHREESLLQNSETHSAKELPSSSPSQGAQVADEDFFNPKHIPPPIQVMERRSEAAFDPARIPSSVFTPESNSPMDWSAASNESLFSLHVGNNSFNKDLLMMGADFHKSGDLFKYADLHKSGDMIKSGELFSLSSSSPIPIIEMTNSGTPKVVNSSPIDSNGETPDKKDQTPSLPVSTSTISSHSDGSGVSGTSASSFAFPVLEEAKRDSNSTEEEPVNIPQKQVSKTSIKSIPAQLSSKMPSCSLCCCACSCSCLSWRPSCPTCCCGCTHSAIS